MSYVCVSLACVVCKMYIACVQCPLCNGLCVVLFVLCCRLSMFACAINCVFCMHVGEWKCVV